jgi:hypothetical protein
MGKNEYAQFSPFKGVSGMSVPSDKTHIINWASYEKWVLAKKEAGESIWGVEDKKESERVGFIPLFALEADILENVYKIGLMLTNRETQETQMLSYEESKPFYNMLFQYVTMPDDPSKTEQDKELMKEIERINKEYYAYPYIVEPTEHQKKILSTYGSYWTERDWFPIIGNNQDPSYNTERYLNPRYGQFTDLSFPFFPDVESTVKLFATARNSDSKIKVKHESRPILPAHMWGDLSKGKWVDIDVATGWGELGNRKHPKTLKKEEQVEAWNKWTCQKLQEKCITPDGNIILFWTQGKSWDSKRKVFKKGYWSQSALIDMKSLRPMLPLERIINCYIEENDGYNRYGEYTGSRKKVRANIDLQMAESYRDIYEDNDVQSFSSEGDQYVRMAFYSSMRTDADIDYEGTEYQSSIRVEMKYSTDYEQYACDMFSNGDHRNAQMKVWLPEKTMRYDLYSLGIINCI